MFQKCFFSGLGVLNLCSWSGVWACRCQVNAKRILPECPVAFAFAFMLIVIGPNLLFWIRAHMSIMVPKCTRDQYVTPNTVVRIRFRNSESNLPPNIKSAHINSTIISTWHCYWQCKYLMYCIFPVLKPLACGRQPRCLGWTYKLPGGQKFSIKLSCLSVGFPQRRALNLIKRPQLINSPGVRL